MHGICLIFIDFKVPCISHVLIGVLVEPISQDWIDFVVEAFVLNGGNIKIMPGTFFSNHAPIILGTFGQSKMASMRFRIPEKVMLENHGIIK